MKSLSAPPDLPAVEALLPQRGDMLLLDRVTAFDENSARAECTPRADAWYADTDGNMPAWIGIELMAQGVASHVGLLKQRDGTPPKVGVLLGTRAFRATQPHFPAARPLSVHVKMIYRDVSGLGAYDCAILSDGLEVASATLTVFEPEDFQTLLQGNLS